MRTAAAQTASGSQSMSAFSYPVSNIDAWSINLTSAGDEFAEYSIDKSFQTAISISNLRARFLKLKCIVEPEAMAVPDE